MSVIFASRRVLEKCGLVLQRTCHPDWLPAILGAEQGAAEYALTREEWLRAQPAG